MKIASLSTARLRLSAPDARDIPEIVRLANNIEVVRTLARVPHPFGPEDARYFLDEVVPKEPTWRIGRKSDGALLGFVGLNPMEKPSVMERGYWFGQEHWRQGYATEAARAVVDHAFSKLGVETIVSGHFAMNPASGRVLAKIGFRETGRSKRFSQVAGEALAHVDVVLERSTWRGRAG